MRGWGIFDFFWGGIFGVFCPLYPYFIPGGASASMGGCPSAARASPLVFWEGGWGGGQFYFCDDVGGHGLLLFYFAEGWPSHYRTLYEPMVAIARKKYGGRIFRHEVTKGAKTHEEL